MQQKGLTLARIALTALSSSKTTVYSLQQKEFAATKEIRRAKKQHTNTIQKISVLKMLIMTISQRFSLVQLLSDVRAEALICISTTIHRKMDFLILGVGFNTQLTRFVNSRFQQRNQSLI